VKLFDVDLMSILFVHNPFKNARSWRSGIEMTEIEIVALCFCAAVILSVFFDVLRSLLKRRREDKTTARSGQQTS